jgi:hypothetical protein
MLIRAASEGMLELTEALLDGNADIEVADAVRFPSKPGGNWPLGI